MENGVFNHEPTKECHNPLFDDIERLQSVLSSPEASGRKKFSKRSESRDVKEGNGSNNALMLNCDAGKYTHVFISSSVGGNCSKRTKPFIAFLHTTFFYFLIFSFRVVSEF